MVVAIVLGLGAIVATYRSAGPRHRLHLYTSARTPLLHHNGKQLGLRIMLTDQEPADPQLVTVNVVSRGRRDITRGSFDGPIVLDVGTRIIGQLAFDSEGAGVTPPPPVELVEERLEVQPSLIKAGQRLSYTLLVDGTPAFSPRCKLSDVEVVTVRPEPEITVGRILRTYRWRVHALPILVVLTILVVLDLVAGSWDR
ncbi:hypothetical protein AB0C38_09545 [Amycolatopsis sp. NPDC048633]|uniref:hypothetical protein n=1 Tax=Amycolatopsis sp. NPDC048633 TaxID=3157095 RepID=UPI0033C5A560